MINPTVRNCIAIRLKYCLNKRMCGIECIKIYMIIMEIIFNESVAPWLQNSSKNQIIHGIIGILIQDIVPKEKHGY